MKSWYLIVADRGRARFFALEWPDDPELESGPRLAELGVLSNPEMQTKDTDLFTGDSGRGYNPVGGQAPGYDDHRDRHRQEYVERFARQIADTASKHVAQSKPPRLLVVAEPQMLGHLRKTLATKRMNDTEVVELAQDMSRHTPQQIHKVLARHDLVPAAKPPLSGLHYPPGQAPPGNSAR